MQPSTKYDVGDILYHHALEYYVLVSDISVSKWDTYSYYYKFIELSHRTNRDQALVETVDKSSYWSKVA